MKKTLFTVLTLLVCILTFSSCIARIDKEITGDIITDIEKIDVIEKAPDENIQTPTNDKQDEEEIEPVKENEIDALGFIQSLGANVRNEENEADEIALSFLQALKDKDVQKLTELAGESKENFEFVNHMTVTDFVMVPFEFSQEFIDKKYEEGYFARGDGHYAVTLKIDGIPEDVNTPFKNGESVWYLKIELSTYFGYPVTSFVPYERAENDLFYYSQKYEGSMFFADQLIGESQLRTFDDGKYIPSEIDLSNGKHIITHLMAYFTEKTPPYSFVEVNEFIAQTFDGHLGIGITDVPEWASFYADDVDFSDPTLYTDPERKLLGCAYGHGGVGVSFIVVEDEKNGTERTVTVDFYSDYIHLGFAKRCIIYFDESNEYPLFVGAEIMDSTGAGIASYVM